MAKSLRSKRRRKVRAEKRIVNAKKELAKLQVIAGRLHNKAASAMEAIQGIPDVQISETPMHVDGESKSSPANNKLTSVINNQWMNQRKIKSIKSRIKRHNTKKARRGPSAGLSSRKAKKSAKR